MPLSSYQRPHNLYMEIINRHFADRKLVLWAEGSFPPLPTSGMEVEARLHTSGASETDVHCHSDLESQRDLHTAPRAT